MPANISTDVIETFAKNLVIAATALDDMTYASLMLTACLATQKELPSNEYGQALYEWVNSIEPCDNEQTSVSSAS